MNIERTAGIAKLAYIDKSAYGENACSPETKGKLQICNLHVSVMLGTSQKLPLVDDGYYPR